MQKRGLRIWDYRMIDDDPVTDSLRYQVLKRDGGKCLLCGALAKDKPMQVDHIIPRSKGGLNSLENLQTLCFECNVGKNNPDDTDFRLPPVPDSFQSYLSVSGFTAAEPTTIPDPTPTN